MNHHKIQYQVANGYRPDENWRHWNVDVHATHDELVEFAKSGYLIRDSLFKGKSLKRLQDALNRLEKKEWKNRVKEISSKRSWGFFPRHLVDKDQAFLELVSYEPLLSIARAMMGPLIRLRVSFARICYPGRNYDHQTSWHQHMTVIPNPLPPWFSRPHCIDCMIYLDDINADTGPLVIVPGSHNWLDREPPLNSYDTIEGEIEIRVKAGSVVLIHGNLWHKALTTLKAKRRLLVISYTPTWLRRSPHDGPRPKNGLTKSFLEEADFEEKMLLGVGGHS